MVTKLQAAQIAARSGVTTIIAAGTEPNVIERLAHGEAIGTRFEPTSTHIESRKRWLLTDKPKGSVVIDAGAYRALTAKDGASLLPVGIKQVTGNFKRGATISVHDVENSAIAHGVSSYDSDDLRQLCGQKSNRIIEILGYTYGDEAIHRNNLVMLVTV
jgi:glutamate 5-kinase